MKSNTFKLRLLYFCTFLFLSSGLQAADIAAGKLLFSNNCGSCHNKNMKDKLTGPGLGGAETIRPCAALYFAITTLAGTAGSCSYDQVLASRWTVGTRDPRTGARRLSLRLGLRHLVNDSLEPGVSPAPPAAIQPSDLAGS